MKIKNKGKAIVIAWPQTYCKQAGGWYDPLLDFLGFSKNHYYQVGHAAVVLVNPEKTTLHYFDFGRYHAPFGFGRVRSELTDPELKMIQKAVFSEDKISNLPDILKELNNRKACHGDGDLHASVISIDFNLAYNKAISLQELSPIPYGPFVYQGNNCSRFVNDVVRAGRPALAKWFQLILPLTLSPTPMGNVKAAGKKFVLHGVSPQVPFCQSKLDSVLSKPIKHTSIPANSKWLAGEGAGSWFHISVIAELFIVKRFGTDGELEFSQMFESEGKNQFSPHLPFELDYPSHFHKITIQQLGKRITLKPVLKSKENSADGNIENMESLQLFNK